jgi:serine phosphatase RsbU (regulator of sigma subunit)
MRGFVLLLFLITGLVFSLYAGEKTENLRKELAGTTDTPKKIELLGKLVIAFCYEAREDSAIYTRYKLINEINKTRNSAYEPTRCFVSAFCFGIWKYADSSAFYVEKGLKLYPGNKDHFAASEFLFACGQNWLQFGDYPTSIDFFSKALQRIDSAQNQLLYVFSLIGLGTAQTVSGNKVEARENLFRALNQYPGEKFPAMKIQLLNILGSNFMDGPEPEKSLEYFDKALSIAKQIQHPIAIAQVNTYLGNYYYLIKNFPLALKYYDEVLIASRAANVQNLEAAALGNMASVLADQGNYQEAIKKHHEALRLFRDLNDKQGETITLTNLGDSYRETGKTDSSIFYYLKSQVLSEELGSLEDFIENYHGLYRVYESKGDFKNAFHYHKLFKKYSDSVFNAGNSRKLTELELRYKFAQEQKIKSLEHQKEIELSEARENRQKLIIYFSLGGLLLLVFLFVQVFNRSRERKKTNEELITKNEIIEEKNKEITDSIFYAQRIQSALLNRPSEIQKFAPDHFILNLPKDIVSGDFFWSATRNNKVFFVLADCTGHGVPGAFMSMIGVSYLEDIIIGRGIETPGKILDLLREKIIGALNPSGSGQETRDGMDMILVSIDLNDHSFEFSGAGNPLWKLNTRDPGKTFVEILPDKQPVGFFDPLFMKPFTTQKFSLAPGDILYGFSDGYADQFGGPKGKKLKYKALKELILSNAHLPCSAQKEKLQSAFLSWKGDLEQIDDVLVAGIRF